MSTHWGSDKAQGWYGVPGTMDNISKVHAVLWRDDEYHPICGTPIRHQAEFQFCATGHPKYGGYVECERCLSALRANSGPSVGANQSEAV